MSLCVQEEEEVEEEEGGGGGEGGGEGEVDEIPASLETLYGL